MTGGRGGGINTEEAREGVRWGGVGLQERVAGVGRILGLRQADGGGGGAVRTVLT